MILDKHTFSRRLSRGLSSHPAQHSFGFWLFLLRRWRARFHDHDRRSTWTMPFTILTSKARRWHVTPETRWRRRWSWTSSMRRWGRHGWWATPSCSMRSMAASRPLRSMRIEMVARWWPCLRFWLRHWPHVHRNRPIRFDHGLPYLWENNLSIGTDQIVMTLLYMWTNDINMQESLLDKLFHTLDSISRRKEGC